MRRIFAAFLLPVLLASCAPVPPSDVTVIPELPDVQDVPEYPDSASSVRSGEDVSWVLEGGEVDAASLEGIQKKVAFGKGAPFVPAAAEIAPSLAVDFSTDEISNIDAMEEAYGVTFTPEDRAFLEEHKFIMKTLPETSIRPQDWDNGREFAGLYKTVSGPSDFKERGQENAVFYSADVFLNGFSTLLVELLKEAENEEFSPAIRRVTETLFKAAHERATADGADVQWKKIRNYFAVPYALLATVRQPLSQDVYVNEQGELLDPEEVMRTFREEDAAIDTLEACTEFVRGLSLDAESEAVVLADLGKIFSAGDVDIPGIFRPEFEELAERTGRGFAVDFSQFTPRSHYTSSSLRRQYFRAMKWYIQIPFFLQSPALTTYAFGIAELFSENAKALEQYAMVESAIGYLVGESDDLMPVDYLLALFDSKDSQDPAAAAMEYLAQAKDPMIKDLSATYGSIGEEQSDEVRLATKGMRFFSGKFIVDSYWTGMLTQGDEAPRPGYPEKLPPMASSLQVMALLGSEYARTQIPKLDFYERGPRAIEKALTDLAAEDRERPESFYQETVYHAALWAARSIFSWRAQQQDSLPRFMQSPLWEAKDLMTVSGFWTELRHAVLLYAKQSFAELGGGPGGCDTRKVPPPPMGYIEPQLPLYERMIFLAEKMKRGFGAFGFELSNSYALDMYIDLLSRVRELALEELKDTKHEEVVVESKGKDPFDQSKDCIEYVIEGESRWEEIRKLVNRISDALPRPVEGPILSAKDKRAAIVADVHTGGDSSYPTRILYEGTGVPVAIFVAVKDSNGPRLTVGFTYAHYELTEPYGGKRKTDEEWQAQFYGDGDVFGAYEYQDASQWPSMPYWYDPLFTRGQE